MSSLHKIIKGSEVPDDLLQLLTLRARLVEKKQPGTGGKGPAVKAPTAGKTVDCGSVLQEWAVSQAEETIRRARATADGIIMQVQAEVEQTRQQAYQSAYERGLQAGREEGYRDGLTRAAEEAEALREQARQVLSQAEEVRLRTLEAVQEEVAGLGLEIAEKLVAAQLALDPGTVLNVAAESLRLVADRLNVVLYVSPETLEAVQAGKSRLLTILPARAELQIIADAMLQPGGCRVETERGRVEATMEKRLEELSRALYDKER